MEAFFPILIARTLLLGCLSAAVAHAQVLESAEWREANHALQSQLWEVATPRFLALLPQAKNPSETKQIAEKVLESSLRGQQSQSVLDLLAREPYLSLPSAWFWRAQAQIQLGQYQRAISELEPAASNAKLAHAGEALLSRAALQHALEQPDAAIATLEILATLPDFFALAQLRQAEIFLESPDLDRAQACLDAVKKVPPAQKIDLSLCRADLLLAQKKISDANVIYTQILSSEQSLNRERYFRASIGVIQSQRELTNRSAALAKAIETWNQLETESWENVQRLANEILALAPEKLTPNDPIFEQVKSILPPGRIVPVSLLIVTDPNSLAGGISQLPQIQESEPRDALALWIEASLLERLATPESLLQAQLIYRQIHLQFARTPLAPRALLATARLWQKQGETEQSISILENLTRTLGEEAAAVRGRAAFSLAEISAGREKWGDAAEQFERAASFLRDREKQTAQFNAAIMQIQQTQGQQPGLIKSAPTLPKQSELAVNLELEQIILEKNPATSLARLKQFIAKNPQSPRLVEAYFSAISAALRLDPPDLSAATQLLDDVQNRPDVPADQLAWTKVQLSLASATTNGASIEKILEFRRNFPDSALTENAIWQLGQGYFRNRDYNNARLTLEKFALERPRSPLANQALLLSARSAALGATEQSRVEALAIFQKVIASNDVNLAPIARLELARLQIDLSQMNAAIAQLSPWYAGLDAKSALRVPAGILLGEALYAQHTPESLDTALHLYEQLLKPLAPQTTDFARLSYLRGLVLEQKNQVAAALDSYFTVLQQNEKSQPSEWEWLERCGFRALKLLEDAKRWEAAISIAEQISQFHGPRANDATERAKKLRLEHMIWVE